MEQVKKVDLNWGELGFAYKKTDWRYVRRYRDGVWEDPVMTEDNGLRIEAGATALQYGQTCFEGLKAFTAKDGRVLLFRPHQNARRMIMSCQRLIMAYPTVEDFVQACVDVCRRNLSWIPPYGSGASFYLRPFVFGCGHNLGVKPAPEYIFSVFGSPVGPYFKSGFRPVRFVTTRFDRAAPHGTGGAMVGGNYGASMLPHEEAQKQGFQDAIYLDPATHSCIEEVGAANFFGITHDGVFVTPKSQSILPSITKYSLMELARTELNLVVEERDIPVAHLDVFAEAGACGTAAVITPIGSITHEGRETVFGNGTEPGPVTRKLYDLLTRMQTGDLKAPEGWIVEV